MRKRSLGAIVGLASALALVAAGPASAATQAGNGCQANAPAFEYSAVGIANAPGNALPATIPSAGVITSWTLNAMPEIPPNILAPTLKIMRPNGVPNQFQVAAQSAPQPIGPGLNTFPARISVAAGDHIGMGGSYMGKALALICQTAIPGDAIGLIKDDTPLGATATLVEQAPAYQVPIVVSVEPDADGDGFGDETQDKCPQAATIQAICPVVAIEAASVIKEKKSVVVLVTTSYPAPVSVSGTVNLGKGKKANLSSKVQTVSPGSVTRFKLGFTKALKKKLAKLPKTKTLPLKITASATDVVGRVTADTAKAALKGQAKAKKKKSAKKKRK